MRSCHREAATFSWACWAAVGSISRAVMSKGQEAGAWAVLCASMRAMMPVPVPMSRREVLFSGAVVNEGRDAHTPRRTPSVPTFMAQRSWWMMKWRNWKEDMGGGRDEGRPKTAATGTRGTGAAIDGCDGDAGRRQNRRLRRRGTRGSHTRLRRGRGYFLSWAAKKEARIVPDMLW